MLAFIWLFPLFWMILDWNVSRMPSHSFLRIAMCGVGLSAISDSFANFPNASALHPIAAKKLALIGIWTAHWKKERRALIRMTYLRNQPLTIDYYFFVCSPITPTDRLWIAFENKMFQDVVVMKCIDNSHHGKIWNFLQSVRAICDRTGDSTTNHNFSLLIDDYPHISDPARTYDFIVKADDDSFVHLTNLASTLATLNKTSTYYGRFWYRNTNVPFAVGMLWTLSYDLVEYLANSIHNDSSVIYGPEDYLIALWFSRKPVNIVDDQLKFIDHYRADSPIRAQHHHDTICIHQLKNDLHFMEIVMFYEQ